MSNLYHFYAYSSKLFTYDRMMMPLSGLKQLTFCVVRVLNVSTKLPTFVLNVQAVLVHLTSHCVMPSEQSVKVLIRIVNQFMSKWLELN